MKASEMVKNLNDMIEKYGDLDLIYSVDDEGNAFNMVNYSPSFGDFLHGEFKAKGSDDWNDDANKINTICIN